MSQGLGWFGRVDPDELRKIVVVSPHMDDAVLGAGHLLATHPGCTVVTVFAGAPSEYPTEPTPWDASGGFAPGDDVVAARRREDRQALGLLRANPEWLDFVDHQYLAKDERPSAAEIADALEQSIAAIAPTAVFLPMGLANPDHVSSHEAGLQVRSRLIEDAPTMAWFCYEDSGYKHIPGLLAWRVSKLFHSGLWPTPAVVPVDLDAGLKRSAILLYESQLPPLRAEHDLDQRLAANVPEQFWRLDPPPPGWDSLADLP